MQSPVKSCTLDPVPTFLVREFIDLLLPYVTMMVNGSLIAGRLPDSHKHAIITPHLKKSGLDPTDLANFWLISNLTFLLKVVERALAIQLNALVACQEVLVLGLRIAFSESARDLGVIDREKSLTAHVAAVCQSSYYLLRHLRPIVHSLSVHATKTLVQAFISCCRDYCNSLLYGMSDGLRRLQLLQNAAARLVSGACWRDHIIRPVLQQLHWPPV